MGRRINIQYSIDLEELPLEVNKLVIRAADKLSGCNVNIKQLQKEYNQKTMMTTASTHDISLLRAKLADVDYILADIDNLIKSYVSYQLNKETDQSDPTENEEEIPSEDVMTPDELEKRIEEFKNTYG
jgi:chromosome segregation ATPase